MILPGNRGRLQREPSGTPVFKHDGAAEQTETEQPDKSVNKEKAANCANAIKGANKIRAKALV